MEDLLPILIGIIWVAYTLYNRGQKKRNVRQPVTTERSENKQPSIFEQILMGGQTFQPQPYSTVSTPVEEEEPESYREVKVDWQKKSPTPFLNEELAQFVHEGQSVSNFDQHNKTLDELLKDKEIKEIDFDLKKAIIYSEILNTPYIGYK
jgi:hypothetical protein